MIKKIFKTITHKTFYLWGSGYLFISIGFIIFSYIDIESLKYFNLYYFLTMIIFSMIMISIGSYHIANGIWTFSRWKKYIFNFYCLPISLIAPYYFLSIPNHSFFGFIIVILGTLMLVGILDKDKYFLFNLLSTSSIFMWSIIFFLYQGLPYEILIKNIFTGILFYISLSWIAQTSHYVIKQDKSVKNLLKQVKESRNIINGEKKKSEDLLLNILPVEIAKELKENGASIPKLYSSASVLFTDFIGFTKIASFLKPEELVYELDHCFSYFDSVIKKYNLEKIKTIGDSYMACGGIPQKNNTHPIDVVLAGIEIQSFMKEMKTIKESLSFDYWELRLGINTGPLVAGVIGEMKFAYDIFGDTVNTASRMESSGDRGQINISQSTYELVKDFFNCEYRGKIPAKNKGEIEMYYVRGIKDELSVNSDNKTPNQEFFKLYNEL